MFRFIYLAAISFALAYLGTGLWGVMNVTAPSPASVIYSLPLFVCSFVLLVSIAVHVITKRRAWRWAGLVLFIAALALASGFWMDALKGYTLRAVITEGQSLMLTEMLASVPAQGYAGKYARVPVAGITLKELSPGFAEGGASLASLHGAFIVAGPDGRANEVSLALGQSAFGNGYRLSMEGFGYSPRYELISRDGGLLDSSFVYLRLFPPGSEDSFRLLSPLTYYLRYFPEGEHGPYFKVRVARNKSLVYSGEVPLGGAFRYENASMALPEVRRWTTLSVSSYPGRPLVIMGALGMLLSLVYIAYHHRRGRNAAP